MFTFVVTCYNQAEVVTHALESIRYQICRFGKDQKFQLIVADDGSEDSSCEVIEQWITGNRDIFEGWTSSFGRKTPEYAKIMRRL